MSDEVTGIAGRKTADADHIERQRPFLAVYCFVLNGRRLLMLKRVRTRYGDGFWSVPAGHVDAGESVLAAASREVREEAGIVVDPRSWSLLTLMHRQTEDRAVIDVFLRAETYSGTVSNYEPDKHDGLSFYDLSELPGPLLHYVHDVLSHLEQGRTPPHLLMVGWP